MKYLTWIFMVLVVRAADCATPVRVTELGNGVWRIRFGEPEKISPAAYRVAEPRWDAIAKMPVVKTLPFDFNQIQCQVRARGTTLVLPMTDSEEIYGLGLQHRNFSQRGLQKTLQTCAAEPCGLGESHAPVPFYVSTAGFGVYVDTARHLKFYVGNHPRRESPSETGKPVEMRRDLVSEIQLYAPRTEDRGSMVIDVPAARGVDIYVFGGPIREAVARFNLFCGGGCLPALYGLAPMYQGAMDVTPEHIMKRYLEPLRTNNIPVTLFTIGGSWQTKVYPSSQDWNGKMFPDPARAIAEMNRLHFQINVWTQPYLHPEGALCTKLTGLASDYDVWRGMVPDYFAPKVRSIFQEHFQPAFVAPNIRGCKLDECDGTASLHGNVKYADWQLPEMARFPSGADGEQMEMLMGLLYQKTMFELFRKNNWRTFSEVRASHAMAAPLPFVLYSDEYNVNEFAKYVVSCGFHGLLWSPEVRHATSLRDFQIRQGIMTFAPMMQYNAWQFRNLMMLQPDFDKNNAGNFLADPSPWLNAARRWCDLRMRLVPYLYSAYVHYHLNGIAPVRALVQDWPADPAVREINDQWMFGDSILVAPVLPMNAFVSDVPAPVGGVETWAKLGRVTLQRGATAEQFMMQELTGATGLTGMIIPVELEAGVPHTMQFRHRSSGTALAMRLRDENDRDTNTSGGKLYKDAIPTGKDWVTYKEEFRVPATGRYKLHLSKGYFTPMNHGTIEIAGFSIVGRKGVTNPGDWVNGDRDARNSRKVYLPAGAWYDFWKRQCYTGGQWITATTTPEQPPVFVKAGTILPLAKPEQWIDEHTVFQITPTVYGDIPAECQLYEDDGMTWNFERGDYNIIALHWDGNAGTVTRKGPCPVRRYEIAPFVKPSSVGREF